MSHQCCLHCISYFITWKWTAMEDKTFQHAKELLTSSSLLVHFHPNFPSFWHVMLQISTLEQCLSTKCQMVLNDLLDISFPFTVQVRMQLFMDGKGRVILHLWDKQFHSYLVGHHFILYTDHKPLLALMNEHHSKSLPASVRIHC